MFASKYSKYGRIGKLSLAQFEPISTPSLFPVVCLITGTTPKGGGLWKYILQADELNSIMRRNLPVMSQVLHFLDFIRTNRKGLEKWLDDGIKQRYFNEITPSVQYTAPIFLDSGGYKLLWNKNLDLSAYGWSIEDANAPLFILELQNKLGGDMVATLDYPLPPGLVKEEANERMQKSIINAIIAAQCLQQRSDYKPFLYVAAHGQDRSSMGHYIKQVFDKFKAENLTNYPFGLAVGSLVPLRGGHKYFTIIELLRGLQENIPEELREKIPIHVFGVTGSMIPILSYLGIDTFDSSTYIQETRSLSYISSNTGRPQPVLEMENLTCNCRICKGINLAELQDALMADTRGQPLPNGHYKSKYYGDIALHNLEMDFRIVTQTKQVIKSDSLQEYLIEHTDKFPKLRSVLDIIAKEDDSLRVRLSRTVIPQPQKHKLNLNERVISLKYTSDDFDILKNGYYPPQDKQVLLIIPCSGGKPYSQSRSHRLIAERLEQALGKNAKRIHKITLSGLYGPVPEECENESPILGYDFRLEPFNKAQIDLIADRLVSYLERYGERYAACVGYATSRAYRTVLEQATQKVPYLCVLPIKPKTKRLTEFFRKENVAELVEEVKLALKRSK